MKNLLILAAGLSLFAWACASGAETNPVIARVLGREIALAEKDEMDGIIFSALLEKFAAENDIAATPADIEAHIAAMEKFQTQHHQESIDARSAALAELAAKGLSDEARQALEEKVKMYDLFLKTDKEMADYAAEHAEENRKSDEDMARMVIQSWKVNQALYKRYGGRVIFQQGGPEPLDAYRAFLREQEQSNAFELVDKSVEPTFWNYYTNESMHTFYPDDDAVKSMTTPWWLMEKPLGE